MGFMDMIGELAGKMVSKYDDTSSNAKKFNDEKLICKFREGSNLTQKLAYGQEIQKRVNEALSCAKKMEDEELIQKFREEGDTPQKIAYGQELKRRGYGEEN